MRSGRAFPTLSFLFSCALWVFSTGTRRRECGDRRPQKQRSGAVIESSRMRPLPPREAGLVASTHHMELTSTHAARRCSLNMARHAVDARYWGAGRARVRVCALAAQKPTSNEPKKQPCITVVGLGPGPARLMTRCVGFGLPSPSTHPLVREAPAFPYLSRQQLPKPATHTTLCTEKAEWARRVRVRSRADGSIPSRLLPIAGAPSISSRAHRGLCLSERSRRGRPNSASHNSPLGGALPLAGHHGAPSLPPRSAGAPPTPPQPTSAPTLAAPLRSTRPCRSSRAP